MSELTTREVNSKVNALISLISNKAASQIEEAKLKDFIEKYAIVEEIVNGDTIHSMISNVESVNDKLQDIEESINIPLTVINEQSEKVLKIFGNQDTDLVLNIADIKYTKNAIYSTFRDLINYLNDLNITGKIKELNDKILFTKSLSDEILSQKNKINEVIDKVVEQETMIEAVEKVNQDQSNQIDYTNNLLSIMEKQIENYAFFAEEFNKIYLNARDFISVMDRLRVKMDYIETRDDQLVNLMNTIVSFIDDKYSVFAQAADEMKQKVVNLEQYVLNWVETSLLFTNEVKAYNLSLKAYNQDMDNISERYLSIKNNIDSLEL